MIPRLSLIIDAEFWNDVIRYSFIIAAMIIIIFCLIVLIIMFISFELFQLHAMYFCHCPILQTHKNIDGNHYGYQTLINSHLIDREQNL